LCAEVDLYDGRRLTIKERMVGQDLTGDSRSVLVDALRSVGAVTT
jgi:hypothetical protein